jgi:hypothetical protein
MKKSLVLASLLLVGTSSIASNYIEIGYGVRKTESYGIVADDPNYMGIPMDTGFHGIEIQKIIY